MFCSSLTDSCLCEGGGFGIYSPFCNTTSSLAKRNATQVSTNRTFRSNTALATAKDDFPSLFDALSGDVTVILVSVGVVVLIAVIFTFARLYVLYLSVDDALMAAELESIALREQNLRLKEELETDRLDAEQVAMINESVADLSSIPSIFKTDWRTLKL